MKLIDLNGRDGMLSRARSVVDIGASPGGWSQVARQCAPGKARVLALDLLPMEPVDGVETIVADIRDDGTLERIRDSLGGPADLVMSDAAPDISGIRDRDDAGFCELHDAVLRACDALSAGSLLMKTFVGEPLDHARSGATEMFGSARVMRSKATKKHSKECYVLAKRKQHP